MTMGDLLIKDLETLREYRMLGKIEELEKQLRELKHYKKLEKQGLLLRLPCKVGTYVYSVTKDCRMDLFPVFDETCGDCSCCEHLLRYVEETIFDTCLIDEIGKTIFLTREEAEQALEKMKER